MHLTAAALLAYGSILALAGDFGATLTPGIVKHNSTIPLSVKHNVTVPITAKHNSTIPLIVKLNATVPITAKHSVPIPCNNTLTVKPTSNMYASVDTTITLIKVPKAPTATTLLPAPLASNAAGVFSVGAVGFLSVIAAAIVL